MKYFYTLILVSCLLPATSQIDITPTIDPIFFQADEPITITYDVTGTQLSGLSQAWIWMWLPNMSDANVPSNVNPASSNTTATNPAKFTKSTANGLTTFSITLTPTIFYGRPASEITKLGMLLKANDWPAGQTTDFEIDITTGFALSVASPTGTFGFYESGEIIPIEASTSSSAQIQILVDDIEVALASDVTTLSFNHAIIEDGEVHEIKVIADETSGDGLKEYVYNYSMTPTTVEESLPLGMRDGINHIDESTVTLVLRAPNKDNVYVIGTFNNWSIGSEYLMKRDGDQFWITINSLSNLEEYQYQYLVDGAIRIADPYAQKISSPFDDEEIIADNRYPGLIPFPAENATESAGFLSTVIQDFQWDAFTRPAKQDLIIYELLVRDFTEERTFQAVIDRLDYLEDLGINALQLMPVMEFEGNLSWGYNPAYLFAVDKYYGTELDLKTLINEAHKRGMAVIFDIVLNHHFGQNSLVRLYNNGLYGAPTAENPWFNTVAKHPFNVGYDMNHESLLTQAYIDRVNAYWLEEYNIDGYRYDLSKGFTQRNSGGDVGFWGQYDQSRINILQRMADEVWNVDPEAYIILEHFGANEEEIVLSNYGMMLWGNMNGAFRGAAKGNSVSLSQLHHEARGWSNPYLVGYMDSHDEERVSWDLGNAGFSEAAAIQRAKLVAPFLLMVPGPKMIWQFGEFGYDEELNNDRLGIKPTKWEYLDQPARLQLFELYKSLVNLRTKTNYVDNDYFTWNTSNWIKWIAINHPTVKIHVLGNFNALQAQTSAAAFPSTGTWYDYFSGQPYQVTSIDQSVTMNPSEVRIYVSEVIENYVDSNPILSVEDKMLAQDLVLYPNPASNRISITSSLPITEAIIYTLNGSVIYKEAGRSLEGIDIAGMEPGLYFVRLRTANGEIVKPFLKK
jgi:1,4-alpha-glucan branching enzyme